jgi:hypothetical protein
MLRLTYRIGLYWHDKLQTHFPFPLPFLPDSIFDDPTPDLLQLPDVVEPILLKQELSPPHLVLDQTQSQVSFPAAMNVQDTAQPSPATPVAKRRKNSAGSRKAKTGQALMRSSPLGEAGSPKSIVHTLVSLMSLCELGRTDQWSRRPL